MFSVAIVGRPNVGKSTLFNRLLGKKRAIVHDVPGVTRDWQAYPWVCMGMPMQLYDTPGIEDDVRVLPQLGVQAIVWVVDGRTGLTSSDWALAPILRRQPLPVILAVNKAEATATQHAMVGEAARLGIKRVVFVSALHGHGMDSLHEEIAEISKTVKGLCDLGEEPTVTPSDATAVLATTPVCATGANVESRDDSLSAKPVLVTVMGRPNVGKSTFVNRFLGYERMRTGPRAGITTDAVVTEKMFGNHVIHIVDTAGLRRSTARHHDPLERLACQETQRALVFCHVAVVMMDASQGIHKHDLTVLEQAQSEGRALVIALNKWDQVREPTKFLAHLPAMMTKYPVLPLSCVTGQGHAALWQAVLKAYGQWNERLATGPLNRWLAGMVAEVQPPLHQGHRIKIKYITQIKSRPPTFQLFGSQVSHLTPGYLRYLSNGLRQSFGFSTLKLVPVDAHNPYDRRSQ